MSHDPAGLDPDLLRAAAGFSAATLHEAAGRIGALPGIIKPVRDGMTLCGPAFTVASAPHDNLWIHRGLAAAAPGAVLVVTVGDAYEAGYVGDIMTRAARARGLGGLVIDGCVRDRRELGDSGFPVFARGVCIRGTGKAADAPGGLAVSILIGDVRIEPGDLVAGDDDGVVVLPRAEVERAVRAARARVTKEVEVARRLECGQTTLEIYGWE